MITVSRETTEDDDNSSNSSHLDNLAQAAAGLFENSLHALA